MPRSRMRRPRNMPAGPPPMIATWVRKALLPKAKVQPSGSESREVGDPSVTGCERCRCALTGRLVIEIAPAVLDGIVELAVARQPPMVGGRPALDHHFDSRLRDNLGFGAFERIERHDRIHVMGDMMPDAM